MNNKALNLDELETVNGGWLVYDKSQKAYIAVSDDGTQIYGVFYDEPDEDGSINCISNCRASRCALSHGANDDILYGTVEELRERLRTNHWKGANMLIHSTKDFIQWMREHNLLDD